MLLDFLGDENNYEYGLKARVKQLFKHEMVTYEEANRLKRQQVLSFMADDVQPLGIYAMEDARWTWKLYELALTRIMAEDPSGKLEHIFWNIDMKVCRILQEMEAAGVLIDWKWLRKITADLEKEKNEILTRIEERVGTTINPKSVPQVSTLLFGPREQGNLGINPRGLKLGKNGHYPTGSKQIGHLRRAHPVVADILDWRSCDTNQGGFSEKIEVLARNDPEGRLHSHFNQTGTIIFRLSSSDPINLQNQPRDRNFIRKAFCGHLPDEEAEIAALLDPLEKKRREDELMVLVGADYSQIELRLAAHLSGDKAMIAVYNSVNGCQDLIAPDGKLAPCPRFLHWYCDDCNKAKRADIFLPSLECPKPKCCPVCGSAKVKWQKRCRHVDLHQRTAEDVGVERDPLAKNLNFGNLYGVGPATFCTYASLYDENGNPRIDYAASIIEGWFAAYPGIKPFQKATEDHLRKNGWVAQTIFGRRHRLSKARDEDESKAIRQGIQFQVSGSAQDIIKIAMIHIVEERERRIAAAGAAERKLWRKVRMLIQVHDELMMEAPAALKLEVKDLMERNMRSAASLRVPLVVDAKIGNSWDDIH